MSLDFFQPLSLQNLKGNSVNVNYSKSDPTELHSLFETSAVLASKAVYVSADYPEAYPSSYGCWFPTVGSQSELNNYFMKIGTTASNSSYFFFKPNADNVHALHRAASLSEGYANATQVFVASPLFEPITPTNFALTTLFILEDDGPVIIVGVIDTGFPEGK
jgi:hypothetical protein